MTKLKAEEIAAVAQNRRATFLFDFIFEASNKPGKELLPVLRRGYCELHPISGNSKSIGLKLEPNAILNGKIVPASQNKQVPFVTIQHTFSVVVENKTFDVTYGDTVKDRRPNGDVIETGIHCIAPTKSAGGVSMYDLDKDLDLVKFLMLSPIHMHSVLRRTESLKELGIEIIFESKSAKQTPKYMIDVNGQGLKVEDKAIFDKLQLDRKILDMTKGQLESVCRAARISYSTLHDHPEDQTTAMVVAINKAIAGKSPEAKKAYGIVSSYIEMDGSDHAKTVNKAVDLGILTYDGDRFRINGEPIKGKYPDAGLSGKDAFEWLIRNMVGKEGAAIEATLDQAIMEKVGDTKVNSIDQRNEEEKLIEKMMANLIDNAKVTRNTTTTMLEWEDNKETITKCKAPQAKSKLAALKLAYAGTSYMQLVELCKKHNAEDCIEQFEEEKKKSFSIQ